MAYSDATDTLVLLPGLPQTTTVNGYTLTVTLITNHGTAADAFIDSYCARRYTVPFAATSTATPPMVKSLAQDITGYRVYRALFAKDNVNVNDWTDKLASAKETLEKIRSGGMDLVSSSGAVLAELGAGTKYDSNIETYWPSFDVDSPLDWKVDSDRLTDVSGSRK